MAADPHTATRRYGYVLGGISIVAFLAVCTLYFNGALQDRQDPNRNLVVAPGARELVLLRNRAGHYIVPGEINGRPVRFLLDTGATLVSVPAKLGGALGLQAGPRGAALTANGPVEVRATRIDTLTLGPFRLSNVSAHLNPGMVGEDILLGMSALRHLEFTQRGDRLTLRVAE